MLQRLLAQPAQQLDVLPPSSLADRGERAPAEGAAAAGNGRNHPLGHTSKFRLNSRIDYLCLNTSAGGVAPASPHNTRATGGQRRARQGGRPATTDDAGRPPVTGLLCSPCGRYLVVVVGELPDTLAPPPPSTPPVTQPGWGSSNDAYMQEEEPTVPLPYSMQHLPNSGLGSESESDEEGYQGAPDGADQCPGAVAGSYPLQQQQQPPDERDVAMQQQQYPGQHHYNQGPGAEEDEQQAGANDGWRTPGEQEQRAGEESSEGAEEEEELESDEPEFVLNGSQVKPRAQ